MKSGFYQMKFLSVVSVEAVLVLHQELCSFVRWGDYPSTLANLTLSILFSELLKFSKIIFSKSKNIVKKNSENLGIFHELK
jgi:hypothetical protein